jgi:LmbE family N-acetylglucosaminyl deacetylase
MERSDRRVVLAMMAHPDDAEITCAGTLIRLAAAGWEVHIASAAPGDCGTTTEDRFAISARRVLEATASAELIGARYHCLDERDGMVMYDKPALQKTVDLFRRVAPTLVFTHALKDYMLDHEMAALLARAASFIYAAPNITAYPVLAGSRVPHLYYCDPMEGRDPLGNLVSPTTYVDIADQLEKKTAMLACHASQREWLLAHHGGDEYVTSMHRHAAMRGQQAGMSAAEAFVQHRGHAYPRNDLLQELFGGPAR